MSNETQKLMDMISDLESKLGVAKEFEGEDDGQVLLTETEKISLANAKLRLSQIEEAEKRELQRIINDSILLGEGLFEKEQFREIKEIKKEE